MPEAAECRKISRKKNHRRQINMKICITSTGKTLESEMNPKFGRCGYFIIYNLENNTFEAIENPFISATGGAGIKAGKFIADKDVNALLTGDIGPNAFDTLTEAGINISTKVSGKVIDVIENFCSTVNG